MNRIERQCQHPDCAWNGCAETLEVLEQERNPEWVDFYSEHPSFLMSISLPSNADGWDANGSPVEE